MNMSQALRPYAHALESQGVVGFITELNFEIEGRAVHLTDGRHQFHLDGRRPKPNRKALDETRRSIRNALAEQWPKDSIWTPPEAQSITLKWSVPDGAAQLSAHRETAQVVQKRQRLPQPSELDDKAAEQLRFAVRAAEEHDIRLASCGVEMGDDGDGRSLAHFSQYGGSADGRFAAMLSRQQELAKPAGHRMTEDEIDALLQEMRQQDLDNPCARDIFVHSAMRLTQTGPADEKAGDLRMDDTLLRWRWVVQFRTPLHPKGAEEPILIKSERTKYERITTARIEAVLPVRGLMPTDVLSAKMGYS